MRRYAKFLLAGLFVLSTQAAHAQQAGPYPHAPLTQGQKAAIVDFITGEMAREHIPGAVVGVYSRGRLLFVKGFGYSDVELNVRVVNQTLFQSGSTGKQYVSAAIMMLVEAGKLSLDDSIAKYFPEAPASWKPILIKNLLSHTSGLSEYESDERTGPAGPFYLRLDFSEDELMRKIEAMPIEWAPGDKWGYRNTNYVILGILIHKLTGKPYAQFLSEHIFTPLGMTTARLINDHDIVPNRASGYQLEEGVLKNQDWVSPTFNSTADGALYFTVYDIAKWDEALYGTRLLSQASLDRIWTVYPLNNGKPNPANYGFGWFIDQIHGHKIIEHSGAWQGFTCDIARYPDESVAVAVFANLAGANTPMMANVTAGFVEPALMPAKLDAIADNDPSIAVAARTLLDRIVAGTDIRPQATAEIAAEITPDGLKQARKHLTPLWPALRSRSSTGNLHRVHRT